jgi:transposase-like protein
MFPISYRDLELMLRDRGVEVDHTTIFRWIQAYAVELEKRIRPHLRLGTGSWRMDETYIRVRGRWTYLYRAVDSRGQTIDFLLSAKRDAAAAKRFFRKATTQPHTVNPRTITVDKSASRIAKKSPTGLVTKGAGPGSVPCHFRTPMGQRTNSSGQGPRD